MTHLSHDARSAALAARQEHVSASQAELSSGLLNSTLLHRDKLASRGQFVQQALPQPDRYPVAVSRAIGVLWSVTQVHSRPDLHAITGACTSAADLCADEQFWDAFGLALCALDSGSPRLSLNSATALVRNVVRDWMDNGSRFGMRFCNLLCEMRALRDQQSRIDLIELGLTLWTHGSAEAAADCFQLAVDLQRLPTNNEVSEQILARSGLPSHQIAAVSSANGVCRDLVGPSHLIELLRQIETCNAAVSTCSYFSGEPDQDFDCLLVQAVLCQKLKLGELLYYIRLSDTLGSEFLTDFLAEAASDQPRLVSLRRLRFAASASIPVRRVSRYLLDIPEAWQPLLQRVAEDIGISDAPEWAIVLIESFRATIRPYEKSGDVFIGVAESVYDRFRGSSRLAPLDGFLDLVLAISESHSVVSRMLVEPPEKTTGQFESAEQTITSLMAAGCPLLIAARAAEHVAFRPCLYAEHLMKFAAEVQSLDSLNDRIAIHIVRAGVDPAVSDQAFSSFLRSLLQISSSAALAGILSQLEFRPQLRFRQAPGALTAKRFREILAIHGDNLFMTMETLSELVGSYRLNGAAQVPFQRLLKSKSVTAQRKSLRALDLVYALDSATLVDDRRPPHRWNVDPIAWPVVVASSKVGRLQQDRSSDVVQLGTSPSLMEQASSVIAVSSDHWLGELTRFSGLTLDRMTRRAEIATTLRNCGLLQDDLDLHRISVGTTALILTGGNSSRFHLFDSHHSLVVLHPQWSAIDAGTYLVRSSILRSVTDLSSLARALRLEVNGVINLTRPANVMGLWKGFSPRAGLVQFISEPKGIGLDASGHSRTHLYLNAVYPDPLAHGVVTGFLTQLSLDVRNVFLNYLNLFRAYRVLMAEFKVGAFHALSQSDGPQPAPVLADLLAYHRLGREFSFSLTPTFRRSRRAIAEMSASEMVLRRNGVAVWQFPTTGELFGETDHQAWTEIIGELQSKYGSIEPVLRA